MAETIVGLASLQRRLVALRDPAIGALIMRKLAVGTVAAAKIGAPRRTGNLSRSIALGPVGPTSAVVLATANYAAFVEFGTRPHVILPRNRKVLAWASSSGGRRLTGSARKGAAMSFARRVNHPGTRANPFFFKAAEKSIVAQHLAGVVVAAWNAA